MLPTALINEAYVRLVHMRQPTWQNRAHFLALSAQIMRRILVDFARAHRYQKRGGGVRAVTLDDAVLPSTPGRDLVALDDALAALATVDVRTSRVVEMRFFGGLSVAEAAEVLQVLPKTIMREWQTAKVWLLKELTSGNPRRHA